MAKPADPYARDRDVEPRRGICAAPDPRVHPSQPGVEQVAQLVEREIGDEDLAYLGDEDEALARDLQRMGKLDLTGDDVITQIGCEQTQAVDLARATKEEVVS